MSKRVRKKHVFANDAYFHHIAVLQICLNVGENMVILHKFL